MFKNIRTRLIFLLLASCFLSFAILSQIEVSTGPATLKENGLYVSYNIIFFSFLFFALSILENFKKLNEGLTAILIYGPLAGHLLGALAWMLSLTLNDLSGLSWNKVSAFFESPFWMLFIFLVTPVVFLGWLNGLLTTAFYFYLKKYSGLLSNNKQSESS